jgi:hypothetical protein
MIPFSSIGASSILEMAVPNDFSIILMNTKLLVSAVVAFFLKVKLNLIGEIVSSSI